MRYVAPISGFYSVYGQVTKAIPTGQMIEIPNPNRHWYTPWLSKTIFVKEYKYETIESPLKFVYLNEGEAVYLKTYINRIKS